MTALTNKQRVKVNAALATIHAHGFDANAVNRQARALVEQGQSPARAFQTALNAFAQNNPDVGSAMGGVTRLIEASDGPTVARYALALEQYINTGDESGLQAMHDIIVADSAALAVRNGEITEAEASAQIASGAALLSLPEQPRQQADPLAEIPVPTAPQNSQKFSFSPPGQPTAKPAAAQPTPPLGAPALSSATAVRAPMNEQAARRWAGTPIGNTAAVRTAEGGYRAAKTGEALARAVGVPLASVAGQAAIEAAQ